MGSDKRIKYSISTNGLLINESVASYLDEQGFEVQLSFDGVEQAQQYRHPGSFVVLDSLLDNLRQSNPDLFRNRLRVCATLIPATVPYLSDSVRYFIGKGVREIGISPSLMPHADWNEEQLQELDNQMSHVYRESLKHLRRSGEIPLLLFRKESVASKPRTLKRPMCGIARGKSLAVDVDGRVYPCAALARSYLDPRVRVPECATAPLIVSDSTTPDFWHRYAEIRKVIGRDPIFNHKERKYSSYGRCKDCRYFEQCGVCPASIAFDVGHTDAHRVSDFLCAFNMVALKYGNRFPVAPGLRDILLRIARGQRPDGGGA
jgi:radical SAM protein with 4Fe4S-binding SPASM domain